MKKAIFAIALVTVLAASCTNGTTEATTNAIDSTTVKVDTVKVDTTKVDTVKVDTGVKLVK